MGTAGEFGMEKPLGFDEAAPGETFVKIGVGMLEKPDAEPYKFSRNYRIVRALPWQVKQGSHSIAFAQTLPETNGLGYEYVKRIELGPDAPSFTVAYSLRNTGAKPIDTTYYCHNFVVFDDQPLTPGVRVLLPFQTGSADIKEIAEVRDGRVVLQEELPNGKSLYHKFESPGFSADDNQARIENPSTGTGLRVSGDAAPTNVVFYALGKAVCFEPFIPLRLESGEVKQWSDHYEFYELNSGLSD